jgi:preprotein translocase subunit SecD
MLALSRWKLITVGLSLVFGILFTIPNLLPDSLLSQYPTWLPHERLNLGLDLQGGTSLTLEVDTDALRKDRLKNLTEEVRAQLRAGNIQFSDLTNNGGKVSVRISDPTQVSAASELLNKKVGQALAGGGGKDVAVRALPDQRFELTFNADAAAADAAMAVDQSVENIRRRIDKLGTKEPSITRQGATRIVVEVPGESDPKRVTDTIGRTGKLTFQMVDEDLTPEAMEATGLPPDDEILPMVSGNPLAVKKRAVITGDMLTHASGSTDQNGRPAVAFAFNGVGTQRFGSVTAQNIGKRFAIVLDGQIQSAPVIQGAIVAGSGEITGSFTAQQAHDLAVILESGALPAPLKIEETHSVGAEVGADAIKAGEISLGIGAVAIFAFIILAYGSFGVYAAIALVVNVLMLVGALSATHSTLTLPGIAGLILTMAVAVDANVLIYERMRDEANAGRTAMAAADHGYQRAMVSIFDANVTTMISALIMFWLGAGPVKGFALTLAIGVLTSVFTAIVVTQLLIGFWFRTARPKALPIA